MAVIAIASSAGASLAGDVETVSRNCTWCHGAMGRGYSKAFSQQYMWGATANLGPQTARDLATYFSTLPPTPANDGERALAEIGRDIYLEGIPEYDIASCAACHGPNAEGVGQIPRLGGLSYSYLKRRLAQWGEDIMWPQNRRCLASPADWPRIKSQLSRHTSVSSSRGGS
jgi:cytochrome c553